MDIKHGILIAIIIYLLMQKKKPAAQEELPPAPPIKDGGLNVCSNFVDQYGTGKCSSLLAVFQKHVNSLLFHL
jgi:hypothetical protein